MSCEAWAVVDRYIQGQDTESLAFHLERFSRDLSEAKI